MNNTRILTTLAFLMYTFALSFTANAATQTASPTNCTNVNNTSGTQAWSNAGNAETSNGADATASVSDNQTTEYLWCVGYGFSIPAGSTINGITVNVERAASGSLVEDAAMRLIKAGVLAGLDRSTSTQYTTTDVVEAHGSATDLWGTTWTVADINNANFGAAFAAVKAGTAGGSRTVSVDHIQIEVDYTPVPAVSSINRAGTNPAYADDSVSWTVTFNTSVTGVDATDFALVMGGGVSGAAITSVTGSGTTWTVTASAGGTNSGTLGLNLVDNDSITSGGIALGGSGAGNGNFTGQVYTIQPPFCAPPSNVPSGVTVSCVCDRFGRASLNPSTIYGANWIVSTSDSTGIVPYINATTGLLRLTENTGNNAKAATVPGIFPAAGNYISVEFQHFAYGGSGADGIAVTLSDYSVTAVPGAFGGSLGYAQKTPPAVPANVPGFAGGWIGVGIDEFGNYQNPTEGRVGGPGARVDSVGVRGSGSGVSGYNWIAGTLANLSPAIDNTGSSTPSLGHYYQVIVDARNDPASTSVEVNRNTGSGYVSLINIPNVYTAATAQGFTQSPVPANWQISFTGSTGGATNVHEIGGLRVCAQVVAPPSGGTAGDFNAIDEAYGTPPSGPAVQSFLNGHIYTKIVGVPFKLNIAPLSNSQIVTTYAVSSSKNVTVKLVDNSDGVCVLDDTQANFCNATCKAKTAVTGGSQTITFVSGDQGKKQTANFTLNTAYRNLVAIMSDSTTTACSTDSFAVRPASITSVTSTATQTGTTGTPIFKAGLDNFSLTATIPGAAGNPSGYAGAAAVLKIHDSGIQAVSPATTAGTITPRTFSAATAGTPATATGSTFKYSEVGVFRFRGYDPATDATSVRGVYDGVMSTIDCPSMTVAQCDTVRQATWTGIDSPTTKGDCVLNSFSNTKDANGKYGCNFGLAADSAAFGRFTPAYFSVSATHACAGSGGSFTYSGQPFATVVVTPYNATGATINNYRNTSFAKDVTISNAGTTTNFSSNTVPSTAFTGTTGSSSTVTYTFPVKDTAPATLTLRATDTDSVSSTSPFEPNMEVRSGRIALQNVVGSELLALSMPARVQYYHATDGWVTHNNDNCTSISSIGLSNPNGSTTLTPPGTASITVKSPSNSSTVSLGSAVPTFSLNFTAPGGDGYVDVNADAGTPSWLKYDWDGNSGTAETGPLGRATFGLYKGSPRHIYLRERY